VFGARGAGTALSRTTAILAGVFMITSLSLTYVGSHTAAAPTTVLDRLSQPAGKPLVPVSPKPLSPGAGSPPPAAPAPASPAH
jgi:preprotein translocase subunit SecG